MQWMAEAHGLALCCHVLDALGIDGAGEDDSGPCALSGLSSVPHHAHHLQEA